MMQLQQVLRDDSDRERTRNILAEMLGPVTLGRDAETGENVQGPFDKIAREP